MKALRRMMAGLVCAALLFGRAAGEASFDFTDGMPDVPWKIIVPIAVIE